MYTATIRPPIPVQSPLRGRQRKNRVGGVSRTESDPHRGRNTKLPNPSPTRARPRRQGRQSCKAHPPRLSICQPATHHLPRPLIANKTCASRLTILLAILSLLTVWLPRDLGRDGGEVTPPGWISDRFRVSRARRLGALNISIPTYEGRSWAAEGVYSAGLAMER